VKAETLSGSFNARGRPTRFASSLALAVFVMAGGGVWSNWYPMERMPALWFEQRVVDGVASFEWYYSEAGAVLCGTRIADRRVTSRGWLRSGRVFAGVVAAVTGVFFIRSGVEGRLGGSVVLGLIFIIKLAVFQRGQKGAAGTDVPEA
jgi:hypothetical protein